MKRSACRKRWFSLSSGPDPAGKMVRYYGIVCRECNREIKHRAGDLTDESVRKVFTRQRWTVGKTQRQHLCPGCAGTARPEPQPQQPPPPKPAQKKPSNFSVLEAAWQACSRNEQVAFIAGKLDDQMWHDWAAKLRPPEPAPPAAAPPPEPVEAHELQRGPHIDSMPIEANPALT